MQLLDKEASGREIESRILARQIDLLYGSQPFAIYITIAMVAMASLYISIIIGWEPLQNSLLLFATAMILRIVLSRWYSAAKKSQNVNLKQAEFYYFIGIVMTGTSWCVATLSLFPLIDIKGQMLLLVLIGGFGTGAQTTMGYLKAPVVYFLLLLFIPLIYVIYYSGFPEEDDVAVAVAVFLYFLFLLRSSLMFYKNTYDMLHFQEVCIDRESELILQKEKANSANLAKSTFLSRMSHELRTPLNAILGFAELQQRDKAFPLTKKQLLRIHKISDAGKHLLSIVNDVLDFSRIETGSMEINLEATDLFEMVLTSMRLVEDKALLRNIDISAEQKRLNISVMADQNRLKQVVVNLLDNAIKFNKLGGSVSIYADVNRADRVRLYIADTGFGIGDGNSDELFLPFSRLGADSLGIDGTGIGLSLCKELVELMGGKIGLDSHSNEGCCFWIELPHVAKVNVLTENETLEEKTLEPIDAMKVLLVEDNLVNSEVAADMLAVINIETDVANNGQQALELFEKNQYSLILMDCEMPVMNGFITTQKLRIKEKKLQQTQQKSVPIIALTAHAISGAREKCLASGMDDFLSKPFGMDALHSILYKWLGKDELNVEKVSQLVADEVVADEGIKNRLTDNSLDGNELAFDSNILDLETLSKLFKKQTENGSNFLSKVIGIYLEQSSKLFNELNIACKKSDVEAVRIISHTLKSSSVNVGALALSDVCRDVELSCERGVLQESIIENLYQSYSEVKAELTALVDYINNLS